MKSATAAQIKKALVFSVFLHAAIFCVVLFVIKLPENSLSENCIFVNLVSRAGNKTMIARESDRPSPATGVQSGKRMPPPSAAADNNVVEEAVPAGQYKAQTAMQPAGKPGAAGNSRTDYQPFYKLEKMPSFKIQQTPVYPLAARSEGIETRVVVEIYISDLGNVDDVKLIKSGGAGFDVAVMAALRGSSFEPGYRNGKPAAAKIRIPYVFKLK